MKNSSFTMGIEDGIDDSDNILEFERKFDDDYNGPIDPDFKPSGATISWKAVVPQTHRKIVVRTNDGGDIPHFHIVDVNTEGKEFSACVEIEKAAYFKHGMYNGTLNSSDRKALDAFLRIIPRKSRITNWHRVVNEWNRNNSRRKIGDAAIMPDYRRLCDN